MERLDRDICYRAITTRDARFDGRLFVGVTSTGIYCRPICPAQTPKFVNCRFFVSAAAAHEAGFRPCLRCRPETAPEGGAWRGTSNTVSRGLALIAEGALDGADVEALANRVGVGARQLRRLFQQHLGASPLSVAQTRRVLLAKQLVHETRLPMTQVALAAGFSSVRRFNETFQTLFKRAPSALRRGAGAALDDDALFAAGVTIELRYRPPYDWDAMLDHLAARAIAGVEQIAGEVYRRSFCEAGRVGSIEIRHRPERHSLAVTIRCTDLSALPGIITRIRRVFDLSADVVAIGSHLAQDPLLAPLVAQRPGLRAPGGFDGFELGVRAILGQQVTLEAARGLAGKLVRLCGRPIPGDDTLAFTFPRAQDVADADLGALGMPSARRGALKALAAAVIADPDLFRPLGTVEETVAKLRDIRGVGEWTAHYIALRAAGESDAFPASDIGLLRGAAVGGIRPSPAELASRAEPWRPWRAYAAQHLWAADAAARTGARP